MHHLTDYEIYESDARFKVTYRVNPSGKQITLDIPRYGVMENPAKAINRAQVDQAAQMIGHTLSHTLSIEFTGEGMH